ncbi:hypothetical protein L6164_016670 [Bauhinia variegata]|uniref:Uncharacterized protein n=1 Tax=Bauhinia variegata TaxID=167791 RepID=A0ACB9NVM2_BAUVA|nr:hypothetical protein L6164_016670 [Bauhinia variegata]
MESEAMAKDNTTSSTSSSLGLENSYYLRSSDNPGQNLFSAVLTGLNNYNPWVLAMTMGLKGKNKFCFVNGSFPMPESTHTDYHRWSCVNNIVMSWTLNSIDRSLAHTVLYSESAATVWGDLKPRFSPNTGPRIYELQKKLLLFNSKILRLHNTSINFVVFGMNYLLLIHHQIALAKLLLTTSLPDVAHAYSLLLQDEAQRAHTNPPLVSEKTSLQTQTTPVSSEIATQALLAKPAPSRNRPRCAHCGILGHT